MANRTSKIIPNIHISIGITVDARTSTPFGLYRDGTELRGVYYAKPEMARAACFYFEDKCDYPILMGTSIAPSPGKHGP